MSQQDRPTAPAESSSETDELSRRRKLKAEKRRSVTKKKRKTTIDPRWSSPWSSSVAAVPADPAVLEQFEKDLEGIPDGTEPLTEDLLWELVSTLDALERVVVTLRRLGVLP